MIEKMQSQFTKYEVARILGARALQLAMDAPILLNLEPEELDKINSDVLKIAEMELESGVLPITVKRPFPERKEEKIKKMSKEESIQKEKEIEQKKREDAAKEEALTKQKEIEEVQDIKEGAEIMELAKPLDEIEAPKESKIEEA